MHAAMSHRGDEVISVLCVCNPSLGPKDSTCKSLRPRVTKKWLQQCSELQEIASLAEIPAAAKALAIAS